MNFNRFSAFTLGVVVTAASVGVTNYANATGTQIVYACANKSTGVIRYAPKKKCNRVETSLSWNVSGKMGEAGPQGLQGARGLNGDAGARGDTGLTGARGETGLTGPAGARGDTGLTGPTGARGDTGPAGEGTFRDSSRVLPSTPINTAIYGGFDLDNISSTSHYSNMEGVAVEVACFHSISSSRSEWMIPQFFIRIKSPIDTAMSISSAQGAPGPMSSMAFLGTGTLQRLPLESGNETQIWVIDAFGPTIRPVRMTFTLQPTTTSCTIKGSVQN